jgi:hypothetical protein
MTEIATLLVEGGADLRLKHKSGASCADICPDKPLKQYLRKVIMITLTEELNRCICVYIYIFIQIHLYTYI